MDTDHDLHSASHTLRRIAENAARDVAPLITAAFRSPMAVDAKRDVHDVVTAHDRAAEKHIRDAVMSEVPGSFFLGEEGGSAEGGRIGWIVDPIDGTANFARGLAYWCISIAAVVDDVVVAGVVFDPIADNMFAADLGGADLNGRALGPVAEGDDGVSTLLTSFPSAHDVDLLGDNAFTLLRTMTLRYRHVHSTGSGALNLAHVAAGWSDGTMGFDTSPWDVAAGAFILEQAGGWFRGFRQGHEVTAAHTALDYVAGSGGSDHRVLLDALANLSASIPAAGS